MKTLKGFTKVINELGKKEDQKKRKLLVSEVDEVQYEKFKQKLKLNRVSVRDFIQKAIELYLSE